MTKLLTEYAPAERSSLEEIEKQREDLFKNKSIVEIINSIPEMILILNKDRQAIFANGLLYKTFEIQDEDELIGKRPGEIFQCHHAFESKGGCGTTEFCRECGGENVFVNSCKSGNDVQECRIIKRNTYEALDLRISSSKLSLNEGQFTLYSVSDISDEKKRLMLERIFFHDVLNTAGGIKAVSELIQDAGEEESEYYKKLLPQLSRKLIEEIQSQKILNSAERSELSVNLSVLNSADIIKEIAEQYKNYDVTKNIKILIEPDSITSEFLSNKVLLNRVIGNMMKNALESSPYNGTIRIGCSLIDGKLKFWVHNKFFIPRNVQLQIFQRSFSTKGRDRGLGTYSMKLLGEKYLKGEVGFSSTEEEGTTFFISLKLNN